MTRQALDAAEALTRDWTFEEVLAMRNAVPAEGIGAAFRSTTLREIGREVLAISRLGLKNRGAQEPRRLRRDHLPVDAGRGGGARHDERRGDAVSAYHTRWGGSIEPVFLEYAY